MLDKWWPYVCFSPHRWVCIFTQEKAEPGTSSPSPNPLLLLPLLLPSISLLAAHPVFTPSFSSAGGLILATQLVPSTGIRMGGKKWHKLFANCLTHAGHCPCYDHQHSVTWRRERCHCCFVSLCRAPRSVQESCSSLWKYLYMTHVYSKQQPGCDGATDHVIILVNVWCVDHQARKSEKHIHNRDSLADTQMDRASL